MGYDNGIAKSRHTVYQFYRRFACMTPTTVNRCPACIWEIRWIMETRYTYGLNGNGNPWWIRSSDNWLISSDASTLGDHHQIKWPMKTDLLLNDVFPFVTPILINSNSRFHRFSKHGLDLALWLRSIVMDVNILCSILFLVHLDDHPHLFQKLQKLQPRNIFNLGHVIPAHGTHINECLILSTWQYCCMEKSSGFIRSRKNRN